MTQTRSQFVSFFEDVAVGPCPGQTERQLGLTDVIDQQPIRCDMTFTKSIPIARQRVIMTLFRQRRLRSQHGDHLRNSGGIVASANDALIVPAKRGFISDRQHLSPP